MYVQPYIHAYVGMYLFIVRIYGSCVVVTYVSAYYNFVTKFAEVAKDYVDT